MTPRGVGPSDATRVEGGPIGACPVCGGREFLVVDNGQEANFYCPGCDTSWHYSMGWVSRAEAPQHQLG